MSFWSSSWLTAASCPGTNGPKSPGMIRRARVSSATCRTAGSAPEYIFAVRSLFAYEREEDHALVIAAGIRQIG